MSSSPAHHGPDSGRSELEVALMAVARGLRRGRAEAIAHTGLAPHQARALRVIGMEGLIRPGVLAERLRITPRSVTEVIDTLVERGLVAREPDPNDRRALILRLTDQGHEVADEIAAIRHTQARELFDAVLSEQDQASLAYQLGRLADHLES